MPHPEGYVTENGQLPLSSSQLHFVQECEVSCKSSESQTIMIKLLIFTYGLYYTNFKRKKQLVKKRGQKKSIT